MKANEMSLRLITDNKRRFQKSMVMRSLGTCLFLTCLAGMAVTAVAARGEGGAPDGWTISTPRDELRPKFSFSAHGGRDGKGSFVIAADEREGLDGWWTKTVPVKGGMHYRFHAARKVDHVAIASSERGRADRVAGRPRAFRSAAMRPPSRVT